MKRIQRIETGDDQSEVKSTSLIMSPSSKSSAIANKKFLCNDDECCSCCITSTSSTNNNNVADKNHLHMSTILAKNRTSSSPSFLQQQSKISSVSSSSSFKREASPTVCCYYISNNNSNNNCYNRSQLIRKQNNHEKSNLRRDSSIPVPFNNSREISEKNNCAGGYLRDKFRKFETSPYNHIKNRPNTTTTTTSSVATFRTHSASDAHESVGENRRIYDDDKNSNFSTSLINCDEKQRLKASAVQNNNNNNNLINKRCKFKFVNDSNNNQVKSSLPVSTASPPNVLADNDFSYIDSSSISRSSSASFKSDEIAVNNLRKYHIPKRVARISCDNFNNTVKNNNHSDADRTDHFEIPQQQAIVNQSEDSIAMDTRRRNALHKFGFGRKSSSSTSSPERKSSKTERLKELTEKLKGNKGGSFRLGSSPPPPSSTNSVSPVAPIPPPRKLKRNSQDVSGASSIDNLSSSSDQHQAEFRHSGKSKSVEPTSLLSSQITRQLARFLRPNTSTSNLESMSNSKRNSSEEKDFLPKLNRPESRSIVGSYTQKAIPFRSASFSQADYTSGKYIKSDIAALKAQIAHNRHQSIERSLTPPRSDMPESMSKKYPLKSELSITLDGDEEAEEAIEAHMKRNSDIETIKEEVGVEHYLPLVQANEVTIDSLLEEESTSPIRHELQQATTCVIPIPVFECVQGMESKEWSPLPEIYGGEEFCHPISEDVFPQAKAVENFIEIRLNKFDDDSKRNEIPKIPEVELNNVALQLDEITEKLKENIPQEEICNVVKTQIPQSKEEFVSQRSFESIDEISISPEIQEVLETVAETLKDGICEERQFLADAIGNANINIVSLICPDVDLSNAQNRENSFLKAIESSPEPSFDKSSFDKSDTEFPDLPTTVRKRHSDANSGSDKSSPNASPNGNLDDKRKMDRSRRRKGIYIQWPALEKSQDTSFEYSANEDNPSLPYSELPLGQCESIEEPCTPESEHAWRKQSLTYQSSDERDDPLSSTQNLKQFRVITPRSESMSISDNESDRGGDKQDLKRYSKRPLRGPYGQMLEAEMKKPTKVKYDGILEELCRSDSLGKSNTSLDSTSDISNRVSKFTKRLPVPIHQRTGSSPETSALNPLLFNHKKYSSNVDQRTIVGSSDHLQCESMSTPKKLSFDSFLSVDQKSPKRTSSDTTDKHLKRSDKAIQKRSFDEIQISTPPVDKKYVLNTPDTPNIVATPELLAELLKGSSEKLLTDQTHNKKHQIRNSNNQLPSPVLNSLNNLDTRTHVVVELFNTEKNFVESLRTIVQKYLNPLKLPENSGIIEAEVADEIFFMVPSILNIHERFLDELKKRLDNWDGNQCVGGVYIDVFSKPIVLDTYIAFVNNWNKAKDAIRTTKTTRPAFAKFLEAMARDHKGKLSLDTLLIKPVQKFPNYELIFQRLCKHTDTDHSDYSDCQEALKLVHDILVQLNCKEREALENGQREAMLRELENVIEGIADLVMTDRSFILFDIVSMPSGGQTGRKERGFFLFSDMLVITSVKKRSGTYRKINSVPGNFSSTLDSNKYKFLTKISLDDLEIVRSKDENIRRMINEIENLTEDSNKLQQILDLVSTLRCTHQTLEESIRDLQLNIQRQLSERQSNDSQLNILELNVNEPSGTQSMTIVFSKPEKRTQWEETFTETKQKLIASNERFQIPEFIASVPIRKTRSGLQFTCAASTLGSQKDVWVCNSDGYVGQVCVLSLNQLEPTVKSCNGVCNSRILCIEAVPENISQSHQNHHSISTDEDATRASFVSISNSSTTSNKTMSTKSMHSESSSSDSEEPEVQSQSVSSSVISNLSQLTDESQMWLGLEDGCCLIYNCSDNIRIKKNKIKIQHVSAVHSILYMDNRVFVSLANGHIYVYTRRNSAWNTTSPRVLSIGSSASSPVTKLLNVYGKLWCAIAHCIKILNTSTLEVESNVEISSETKPISNMTLLNQHVWISLQNSATILCCSISNLKIVNEVNLAPAVNKMLSNCDNIIQQHKAACLRVTSLLACNDILYMGTSAGVILRITQDTTRSTPMVTGIPQGHTGHVRFLTSVEINESEASKSADAANNSNHMLIISGGDGFEDFRTSGTNTMNEVAGREDSTNHLLLWQQT